MDGDERETDRKTTGLKMGKRELVKDKRRGREKK